MLQKPAISMHDDGDVYRKEWQVIEKAPKDGTVILIALPIAGNLRLGDRRVYEGRWHETQLTITVLR